MLAGDGRYASPPLPEIFPNNPQEDTPHQSQTRFPQPTLKQLYYSIPKYLPQPNLTYVVDFLFIDETCKFAQKLSNQCQLKVFSLTVCILGGGTN